MKRREQDRRAGGRSPGAEMEIRTAVLENAFPTSGRPRLSRFLARRDLPYLFGEGFTRFHR